jgi:hypothetical protein
LHPWPCSTAFFDGCEALTSLVGGRQGGILPGGRFSFSVRATAKGSPPSTSRQCRTGLVWPEAGTREGSSSAFIGIAGVKWISQATDLAFQDAITRAHGEAFGNCTASTLVQVVALTPDTALVRIEATAFVILRWRRDLSGVRRRQHQWRIGGDLHRHEHRRQRAASDLLALVPQQASADLMPTCHGRKRRARLLRLGNDRKFLVSAPAAPMLNAGNNLHPDCL